MNRSTRHRADFGKPTRWFSAAGVLAFALALTLGAKEARAQGGPVDIQQFKPAMDSKGHFTIDSTQVLGPWNTSIGLLVNYANKPLVLKGGGRSFTVNHLVGGNLQFALGMFKLSKTGKPWFEIGVGLPITYVISKVESDAYSFSQNQNGCTSVSGCTVWFQDPNRDGKFPMNYGREGDATGQGLGDIYLHLKFRFLDTSTSPVGLGAMLSIYLPSSRISNGHNKFVGYGGVTLAPKFILSKYFRKQKLLLSVNLGARLRFGGPGNGELRENAGWYGCQAQPFLSSGEGRPTTAPCGSEPDYGFTPSAPDNGFTKRLSILYEVTYGVGMSLRLAKSVEFVAEVFGAVELSSLGKKDEDVTGQFTGGTWGPTQVEYYKNVFPVEALAGFKFYLAASSFFAIGGGVGITGLAGDHAGAPDFRAFASFVFEPTVGDRDGDGIKDDVDKCPDDPEDFDDFQDKDGCPDPDNDNDGIPDVDDKCPNDPENYNGFEDHDGCPDKKDEDRDGDGIPDSQDKCPDVPEDKDGFEDKDGCPDPDNDGDGVLDTDDKCPGKDIDKKDNFAKVKEDRDGFEDTDGCPDLDNDKDGIPDKDDKCPDEPETKNGYKDEDGCPDKNPITITRDRVLILEKIYFETNRAKIKKVSHRLLNTVAATLQGRKDLKLIEIQGHTDERGSFGYNDRLSDRRAHSVRNYLIKRGVPANRVRARGYGERRPKCRQSTEECWSRNRRVEFVIVKRD